MGNDSSKSSSKQSASSYLTQQFSGACNMSCEDNMDNVKIRFFNTDVDGDVCINQKCSTNANCLMSSNMDSITDILLKAANSSSVESGIAPSLSGSSSESKSKQDIKMSVNQATAQSCDVSSYNQMSNVSITAANSNIGGSVCITQDGDTSGSCALDNSMTAAAYATGMAENQASTVHVKKGGSLTWIVALIVIVAIVGIVGYIGYMITTNMNDKKKQGRTKEVLDAKVAAGCPGGKAPILNEKGVPVFDPATGELICPK